MSMTLFGLIFFIAGLFAFCTCIYGAISTGLTVLFPVSLIFLLAFCGTGLGLIISTVKRRNAIANLVENGKHYTAVIVEYRDGEGATVNGYPPLDILVSYMNEEGQERQIVAGTGSYSTKGWPLGATVEISILGGEAIALKETVRV